MQRWTSAFASRNPFASKLGDALRSSVGLATNRYLAKIASDMEKPDGLVALPLDILPEALHQLTLRDLPGIGARTEKRLNEKGIRTMDDLLALDREQAGEIWGSVWGERLWHWLRGEDFDDAEAEHQKSISHSHVLAPEMRTAEKAWAVAHKLLHKAAMRLRAQGLWASNIGLAIGFAVPRGENTPVSRFGVPARGWRSEIKLSECQDNQTLIAALRRLWESRPSGGEYDHPYFIGVQLNNLVPDRLHTLALFDGLEDEQSRTRLQCDDGPDQRQVRHEHAGSGGNAGRIQGRADADRVQQHSGFVLRQGSGVDKGLILRHFELFL